MFPREFKNWDIQNWVQVYQSVQSGVGKLSCNKTALKRCTSTETLWNRKAPSLSSPETILWGLKMFKISNCRVPVLMDILWATKRPPITARPVQKAWPRVPPSITPITSYTTPVQFCTVALLCNTTATPLHITDHATPPVTIAHICALCTGDMLTIKGLIIDNKILRFLS